LHFRKDFDKIMLLETTEFIRIVQTIFTAQDLFYTLKTVLRKYVNEAKGEER